MATLDDMTIAELRRDLAIANENFIKARVAMRAAHDTMSKVLEILHDRGLQPSAPAAKPARSRQQFVCQVCGAPAPLAGGVPRVSCEHDEAAVIPAKPEQPAQ